MILFIDNYDSFTYNLYQYFGLFTTNIEVVRNEQLTCDDIARMGLEKIVLSPGPKAPKDAGICMDVIKRFYKEKPIFGICLGHQCIGEAFGGKVSYAKEIFHGKQSQITHCGTGIFKGVPSPLTVARYHSLAVQKEDLPDCLEITAQTEDGEIMGIRHKEYPVTGVQFHPESIFTDHGKRIIENFLNGEI